MCFMKKNAGNRHLDHASNRTDLLRAPVIVDRRILLLPVDDAVLGSISAG